jgi:hypothetical protein
MAADGLLPSFALLVAIPWRHHNRNISSSNDIISAGRQLIIKPGFKIRNKNIIYRLVRWLWYNLENYWN